MTKPDSCRYAQTLQECNFFLQKYWGNSSPSKNPLLVLEAGGGSFSHFMMPSSATLLALDIDFGQLQRNTATNLRVQADLHQLPLDSETVDVVVCFNVIEHLNAPDPALEQLANCLRQGGTLILGGPDRYSLKGLITRLTPIALHRAFYRYIARKKDRGDGHYDAFETPFHPLVCMTRLSSRLQDMGFELVFDRSYDGAYEYGLTQGSILRRSIGIPYYALGWFLGRLSGNRWGTLTSDFLIVARKGNGGCDA